jgi:hypothetical protein
VTLSAGTGPQDAAQASLVAVPLGGSIWAVSPAILTDRVTRLATVGGEE